MDSELREFQRRLHRSGQDFRVVPGSLVDKTVNYIHQEICRQKIIQDYFVSTSSDEFEKRRQTITELETMLEEWGSRSMF